jgi:hypothetical protein
MRRKRSIVIVAIVAAGALATPDRSVGEDETIWTMAISGTRVEEPSGPVFEMWAIEYKSGTLTGTCSFANFETSKYKPVKVSIEGEWRDGSFWPALKGQVGDLYKGPWYTIPAEAKKMKLSKVEVLPGQEMSKWRVGLNDFLPYVGNYKVGRVVLASGDFAVFELKGLKGADHD